MNRFACALVFGLTLAAPVHAQVRIDPSGAGPAAALRADPIGTLTFVRNYDRDHGVMLGADGRMQPVCYYHEEGNRYALDIGVGAQGAFLRLQTPDSRELTPREPLRVYAGRQIPQGEYGAGLFDVLRPYNDEFSYFIPHAASDGFVVLANGNPRGFLEMIAAARDQYVVVQSRANPKLVNYVAIYRFNQAIVSPLLDCAGRG